MKKRTYTGKIYYQRRRNSIHENFSHNSARQIARLITSKIHHSRSEKMKIEIEFEVDKIVS